MPRTKVSTAITVNLALVDDNNAPITAWTFVAGDVKILAPGTTAWANPAATPVQTTGGNSRGDWQITLTDDAGELLCTARVTCGRSTRAPVTGSRCTDSVLRGTLRCMCCR